jgi:hypothetical protein
VGAIRSTNNILIGKCQKKANHAESWVIVEEYNMETAGK